MSTSCLVIRELEPSQSDATLCYQIEISNGKVAEIISLKNPFNDEDSKELRWFLEGYPKMPFAASRADKIARKLDDHMGRIASQISGVKRIWPIASGNSTTVLELQVVPFTDHSERTLTGFHHIPWEALENPDAWSIPEFPFTTVRVVRRVNGRHHQNVAAPSSSLLNGDFRILFVCARKSLDASVDISSRLVMRPVFEIIEKGKASGRIGHAEILRPATWAVLQAMFKSKPYGWFSEVHFDCHGEVMDDGKSCLLLETIGGSGTEKIPSPLIASALVDAGVSVVNLNACSTATATARNLDANLAVIFAKASVPITIAMSYDVLDVASCRFEEEFYRSLLADKNEPIKKSFFHRLKPKSTPNQPVIQESLVDSVCRAASEGRVALRKVDERAGKGGWQVQLRDDIVPIIYLSKSPTNNFASNSPEKSSTSKNLTAPGDKEWADELLVVMKNSFRIPSPNTSTSAPKPAAKAPRTRSLHSKSTRKDELFYSSLSPNGFRFNIIDPPIEGRDSEISQLEQQMGQPDQNFCFIQGRAGSGKSLFARHLCDWWKSTDFVQEFFYIDCRKVAMPEGAHERETCTSAKKDFIDQSLRSIYQTLWPYKPSRTWYGKKGSLTKAQEEELKAEFRSRRYLLVFDNADFPLCMKDDKLTPTAVMNAGSRLICRDSLIASCCAMCVIGGFIGGASKGQSKIMVTSRYRTWFTDIFANQTTLWYNLPQLSLSSSLAIGQRKLDLMATDMNKYEYPGARADLAAIIELLQFNPLAIEAVFASMIRQDLTPPGAYLKICTSGFPLQQDDASLSFAGGGRFISELQTMTNLDWNDGADESIRPFSMFWTANTLGYMPGTDECAFWYQLVNSLYQKCGNKMVHFGMNLMKEESEVCRMMAKPPTDPKGYEELRDALNLKPHVSELCNILEELGVLEITASESGTPDNIGYSNQHYQIHPLFTLVGRNATWGYADAEYLQQLTKWRGSVENVSVLTHYAIKFQFRFLGGPSRFQAYTSGLIPTINNEDRFNAMEVLQRASKDIPLLINAISWISSEAITEVNTDFLKTQIPFTIGGTLHLIASIAEMKREVLYAVSEVLDGLYQKCLRIAITNEQFLGHPKFVYVVMRMSHLLARMSATRDGLPDSLEYLKEGRDITRKHQLHQERSTKSLGPSTGGPNIKPPELYLPLEITLREMEAFEANIHFIRGDRNRAYSIQVGILSTPTPVNIPKNFSKAYLIPTLFQYLSQLKARNPGFPTLQQMIQMETSINEIINSHQKQWDTNENDISNFNAEVQDLLQLPAYSLMTASTPLPIPPRNKKFDSNLLQVFGPSIGEELVTGLGHIDLKRRMSVSTETTLLKSYLLQSNVAGSSGLASLHMRTAQLLIGTGEWIEALKHLKAYAKLPMPSEDRQNPQLRSQNALLATLCFSRLECWELARGHAFTAVEEAVEAKDDGQSLTQALMALAGLEAARKDAFTLLPKLLVLKAGEVVSHTPFHLSFHPSFTASTRSKF
jgi:hypothetical protein